MKAKEETRKAEHRNDRHQHLMKNVLENEESSEMWEEQQEGVPSKKPGQDGAWRRERPVRK